MEGVVVPPGYGDWLADEIRGEDDGEMGSSVKLYKNFSLCDGYCGWGINDISEELTSLGVSIAPHASGKASVEPTGDDE